MPLRRDLMTKDLVDPNSLRKSNSDIGRDHPDSHPPSRSNTPSKRPTTAHLKRSIAGARDGDVIGKDFVVARDHKRRVAESLKIDLSNGSRMPVHRGSPSVSQVPTLREHGDLEKALRTSAVLPAHARKVITAFDDTETLEFDDHSSHNADNPTMVYRGTDATSHQRRLSDHASQHSPDLIHAALVNNFGPDWQQNLAEERERSGWETMGYAGNLVRGLDSAKPKISRGTHHTAYRHDPEKLSLQEKGQSEAMTGADVGLSKYVTFAQSPTIPSKVLGDYGSFSSPAPEQHIGDEQLGTKSHAEQNGPEPGPIASLLPRTTITSDHSSKNLNTNALTRPDENACLPVKSGFASSRGSDTTTSSEDESAEAEKDVVLPMVTPGSQLANKRSWHEMLDYDVNVLQNMRFDQLLEEQFTHDPRSDSTQVSAVNMDGEPLNLDQCLEDMDEADLKTYFRTQSDEEWVQTGTWFVEKFAHDLRRLKEARCERRKVSMQYEHLIRRRQQEIERCAASVNNELKELKRGGGELIEGRKANGKATD